jgi:hypothetical protein
MALKRIISVFRAFALPLLLSLSACAAQEPSPTREEVEQSLKASAETKTPDRQAMLDEASVVCRNGWAYLAGDNYESRPETGSVFVTPYLKNGVQGRCVENDANFNPPGRE